MEISIIKKFCSSLDPSLLTKLSPATQQFFIESAYICLCQKQGNQNIAAVVLQYFNEIINVAGSWVYQGQFNLTPYQSITRIGVVTIPIIDPVELESIQTEFIETLRQFPEYLRNQNNPDQDSTGHTLVYVLGGFAALGNPASFHNELVRKLRIRIRSKILPLFSTLIAGIADTKLQAETLFEMLIDRMMYRYQSQQPSAESWHRDVIPGNRINRNDEVYGGWLNLDTKDQYFSAIPGSHLGVQLSTLKAGFATVPKDQINLIGQHKHKFRVPPGHVVIFPQYIIHEVVSSKAKHNMMRLFTGWRTTTSPNFIHPDFLTRLQTQDIIPLPSGQLPPMYAANHGSFFLHKQFKPIPNQTQRVNTIEWSRNTMQPITLVDKPNYKIVRRALGSLKAYDFPLYPPYTQEEISLYRPQKILS